MKRTFTGGIDLGCESHHIVIIEVLECRSLTLEGL